MDIWGTPGNVLEEAEKKNVLIVKEDLQDGYSLKRVKPSFKLQIGNVRIKSIQTGKYLSFIYHTG